MRFKISKEAEAFVRKNFPEIDLDNSDLWDVIDAIDDKVLYCGFDDEYDLNEFGQEANDFRNEIYYDNVDES